LEFFQTGLGDERHIRRAAIAVGHPETSAGAENNTQTVPAIEFVQSRIQPATDSFVLEVILWAHNQLAVHHLVDEAVPRERLQCLLRPDLSRAFCLCNHAAKIAKPPAG